MNSGDANDTDDDIAPRVDRVKKYIDHVVKIRADAQRMVEVFQNNIVGGYIPTTKVPSALKELGLQLVDTAYQDVTSFEQFAEIVHTPSKLHMWFRALPVPQLIGDAMSALVQEKFDPLHAVSEMTDSDVSAVCVGLLDRLKQMLTDNIKSLSKSLRVDQPVENEQADSRVKFQMGADILNMEGGNIQDYHEGIEARTGMLEEHCTKDKGGDYEFDRPTMRKKGAESTKRTTPCKEWRYVLKLEECPQEKSRKIVPLEELKKCDIVIKANLCTEEVISVVLYTGPMYHIYNTMLRRTPKDLYQVFKEAKNLFSVSIFVLASAVKNLSLVTKLPPEGLHLYRGLGGDKQLPPGFFHPDDFGCKGYTEWGFTSMTAKTSVAIDFSGVKEGAPCPTVLVIRGGAVDRGARVKELSQYEDQDEYVLLPCSWLEQRGKIEYAGADGEQQGGLVRMIPCDARPNLLTMTIRDMLKRRKNLHLATFRYSINNVQKLLTDLAKEQATKDRLEKDTSRFWRPTREPTGRVGSQRCAEGKDWTVNDLVQSIVSQCNDVLQTHEADEESKYADEEYYRKRVLSMVETQHMALSKLRWWLDDPASKICFLLGKPLRTAYRDHISYLSRASASASEKEKQKMALNLCKVKRLIEAGVDEENELKETRLMVAAAEGRSPEDIRYIIQL